MCDRSAEGGLCGTFGIYVNVLMITSGIGKFIDSVLIYLQLVADADFLSNVVAKLIDTDNIAHFKSSFNLNGP